MGMFMFRCVVAVVAVAVGGKGKGSGSSRLPHHNSNLLPSPRRCASGRLESFGWRCRRGTRAPKRFSWAAEEEEGGGRERARREGREEEEMEMGEGAGFWDGGER